MFSASLYPCFFFFQAEDGIRDLTVTGVQTCALPIFTRRLDPRLRLSRITVTFHDRALRQGVGSVRDLRGLRGLDSAEPARGRVLGRRAHPSRGVGRERGAHRVAYPGLQLPATRAPALCLRVRGVGDLVDGLPAGAGG